MEFDNDDYIPGSIIENNGVTRAKLADLSVGREQIVLGQVWHSHLSSNSATADGAVDVDNLVQGGSFTETTGHVVVVGPSVSVRTPAGSFTSARSFNTVDPADFGGGGVLNYNDPKTLVRLITLAEGKTLTFTNGLPDTAAVRLRNATGTADVDYFVDYTFTMDYLHR